MNAEISKFARAQILEGLQKVTDECQNMFKLMYGRGPVVRGVAKRSVEEATALALETVLAEVQDEKLDNLLSQVQATLKKPHLLRPA